MNYQELFKNNIFSKYGNLRDLENDNLLLNNNNIYLGIHPPLEFYSIKAWRECVYKNALDHDSPNPYPPNLFQRYYPYRKQ